MHNVVFGRTLLIEDDNWRGLSWNKIKNFPRKRN